MPPQTLVAVDTLDDRRELITLLGKLHPERRVTFLEWACAECTRPGESAPVSVPVPQMIREALRCERGDDRLTNSVYLDLVALGVQWDLDMPRAALALEAYVRNGVLPLPVSQLRKTSPGSPPRPAPART